MGKKFTKKIATLKSFALDKKCMLAIFIFIFIVAALPRSVEVLNWNPVFGFDQGREYLMVKDIVDNHNLRLIGTPLGAGSAGFQGIFHGPVYYYLLGIPYIIFDGDPAGGTVFMLAVGLLSLVVAFFLGRSMFGKVGGLVVMTLVGISPLFIAQSRFLWSPYPSTLFVLLSLLFMFHIRKSKKNIFFASFFSAFVYNFEFAIAIPLSIAILIYAAYIFKKNVVQYAYILAGFIIGFLPMILFEVRHNFMAVHGFINYLMHPNSDSDFDFFHHFADHLNSFIGHFSSSFPPLASIPAIVLVLLVLIPSLVILKRESRSHLKEFMVFLLMIPIVNFVILLFLRNAVYHYYLYHLSVVYIIVFTYGLLAIQKYKFVGIGYLALFIAFIVSFFTVTTKMFFHDLSDYGGVAKLKGKVDAIDYIYNDAQGEPFGLFIFTPPVYTYPYDYIIEWKQDEYGYVPHQEKNGVFYLLIEKDSDKPWTYEGWIETVIKEGEVVSEAVLPSGFIVQKRTAE